MNKYFFTSDYLFTIANGNYTKYFLFASLTILTLTIIVRIYLAVFGRLSFYRVFDRIWFFGFLISGLFGLFIYFSRIQALPIFSTRVISYTWMLLNLSFVVFLYLHFRKTIPVKMEQYYLAQRKQKYIKKR